MDHLDDGIEQRLDLLGDLADFEKAAIEVAQLHHSFDLGSVGHLFGRPRISCGRFIVEREHELDVAERELVVVEDFRLPLLLPVDAGPWLPSRLGVTEKSRPSNTTWAWCACRDAASIATSLAPALPIEVTRL
jgi:hypothetical protein